MSTGTHGPLSAARPLVLGSGSPRRREILAAIGVPFVVHKVEANEDVLPGESALVYLDRVTRAKLDAVSSTLPEDLGDRAGAVLVADTSVVLDGEVLGKPESEEGARRMIARLAGRSHEVCTRFVLAHATGAVAHAETVITRVTFRALSPAQVDAYAASGEGTDKAGAYAVQGLGGALVSRIEGSYSNVVGLPACEVAVALERLGLRVP
ncbi:MAG TPA: Maf family protein [Polyangiaceae bacterium]|nr:Maf family protein [Polyangiaceae bacterium]